MKGSDHPAIDTVTWRLGSSEPTTLRDSHPSADEALEQIKCLSGQPVGWHRSDNSFSPKEPPLILGVGAAGIVEQNWPGFKGSEIVIVYGGGLRVVRDVTPAEMVAVSAPSLRRLPDGSSFEEGAALTNVACTAHRAIPTAELKARAGDSLGSHFERHPKAGLSMLAMFLRPKASHFRSIQRWV